MAVYELLMRSMEERNAEHYIEALHDDYEFVRHQSGTTMDKEQVSEMMRGMMANSDVVIDEPRCIYENDEILVEHSMMDFPDGTREAVMAVHTIKDGKIIRTEPGATLIQRIDFQKSWLRHTIQGFLDRFDFHPCACHSRHKRDVQLDCKSPHHVPV